MDFDDLTQRLLVAFLNSNGSTDLTDRLKNGYHRLTRHSTHSWHQQQQQQQQQQTADVAIERHSSEVQQPSITTTTSSPSTAMSTTFPVPPTSATNIIMAAMLPTPARLQQSLESASSASASSAQSFNSADSSSADSDGILYDIFLQNGDNYPLATVTPPGNGSGWLDGTAGFGPPDDGGDSIISRLHLTDFVIGIVLAIVTLATVIGNALVIAAILRERHLRSVGNYLVFSLAVADLMVACLVMPLGALYVVTGQWTLGAAFCDLWTTVDVLCCTASILHLLAIAIDRFWAVTNVDYIHQRRNGRRIGLMILLIWAASIVISLAPIFGWRDPDFPVRIAQRQCLISQDVTYQIFATCASFYVPLALILLLYWRIYQVARKRIRRKPGNKVTLVALQSASNASNAAHVENKVLKKGVKMGGAAGGHLSKTSRKLAKYSAAKYLQGATRLHSDMMSLDTEHCLHASADSLASDGTPGRQAQQGNHSRHLQHYQLGADGHHQQMRPGSPTSFSSSNHHQKSRLSISSIARTTTTCLSSSSQPTSDYSSTNCSIPITYVPHSSLATTNNNNNNNYSNNNSNNNQSSRLLSCAKSIDTAGYSIITEEGSTSSSSGAPPLNSSTVALRCLEGELEPDVNEHSPLPVVNNNFSSSSNATNDLLPSANRSPSLHQQTVPPESPCRCDHNYRLRNEAMMQQQQQQYQPTTTSTAAAPAAAKRHSLAQQNQGRRCLLSPSRAKSFSMSISASPNDANQRALCSGRAGAPFDRYRAQSTDSTLNEPTSPSVHQLSAAAAAVDDDDDDADDVGESATATTTSALDSANRVNNDAGAVSHRSSRRARGYSLAGATTTATTDCVVDFHHRLPPSDSTVIAIDTNYRHMQRMPAEATNGGGAVLPNDGFDQPESELVIATAGDLAVVELVPVHHCNHNANGGLAQQQQQQQQQIHHDHPPAALTVVNITSTTPNELPMSNNKELKEDSTSSSGSTTQPNHNHQPNHQESKGSRKRKPHKQSSEHSNPSPSPHQSRLYQKESIESKRERKAAKTLAIITGVFVICWLPFFINAIVSPLSKTYQDLVPTFLTDIFLWAGYLNSCVNPIIYTIFSPDFRTAFKKMLLGKKTVRSPKGWSNKGMSRV